MAPGGGVEAVCRFENGKAYLEWKMYFDEERMPVQSGEQAIVRICLTDSQGNVAWEGIQTLQEEEPLEGILLQPNLWKPAKDPYLYSMEAVLTGKDGRCLDRVCGRLPLRNIQCVGNRGQRELLLNGETFVPRAVRYSLPQGAAGAGWQRLVLEDLRLLIELGSNCICMEEESGELFSQFCGLCDRFGFLTAVKENTSTDMWVCGWNREIPVTCGKDIPVFRGTENCFFVWDSPQPTSLFYRYKARWSRKPFIYLDPESVKKLRGGCYTVTCYSSCSRVALYTDGTLFEFQRGEGEFVFRDIPAGSPSIMLTAEGDGCSTSLSIHKLLVQG